ncbi:MAG: cadherin domain-containing protein, partial [Flavobacteriaceae bacterium]|nr:cadherin domain-containing protein [Flavobacteriaceae bacterium]
MNLKILQLILLAIFWTNFAVSQTITVTNLNPSGSGSLGNAINQYSSSGGTIVFANNLSGTITISSGFTNITSNLTITGNGKTNTTISGGGSSSRMFSVSGNGNLTLNSLTLKNNGSPGSNAGSIFYLNNVTGGITTNDVLITECSHTISFISNKGTLNVNNSQIDNNAGNYLFRSDWGNTPEGCPINESVFTNKTIIQNSDITNNSGVVFRTERFVKIDNCNIANNSSNIFAYFRGVNVYKVLGSNIENTGGFSFYSWIQSNTGGWGNKILCSDHFSFDGNTFVNSGNITIPGNYGPSFTVGNNSFDRAISNYLSYDSSSPPTLSSNSLSSPPSDISLSSTSVDENVSIGTTVGGLTTTDAGSGDSHTYTLVSGTGDTDNASFSISGANLLTNTALDYETKSSYNIRVQTSDGTDSYQEAFTISVNDLNEAPTDIGFAGTSSLEYLIVGGGGAGGKGNSNEGGGGGGAGGYLTGTITSIFGETFAVTVGAGGTGVNSTSSPGGNGGNSSLAGQNITTVTALGGGGGGACSSATGSNGASGGGGSGCGTDRPGGSGTTGQGNNGGTGRWINHSPGNGNGGGGGGSSTAGTNGASRNAGTIGGGGAGTSNDISGSTTIYTAGGNGGPGRAYGNYNPPNQTGNSGNGGIGGTNYSGGNGANGTVVIRYSGNQIAIGGTVIQSGGYTIHSFTQIENSSIVFQSGSASSSSSSIDEGVSIGTLVGSLLATDEDDSTNTFTLVSGDGDTNNELFSISNSNLLVNGLIDYEQTQVLDIRVQVTDGQFTYDKALTINVNDVNEAPTDIAITDSSVDENLASGTTVGGLTTTDGDNGDSFTYSLVNGVGSDDNPSFSISGANLLTNTVLDYETKSSYNIRVQTSDGSSTYSKTFTITVNDVNETPTDIDLSATAVDENLASGTIVGGLTTTDGDNGDSFTYTLVSGAGDTDNASFSISGANLLTNTALDYETKSSYNIRVQTSDGTDSYQEAFTISINDLTESSITQVTSNNPNGTYIIGETIDIHVTFDNAVTVSGSPRLLLETGDSDSYATYFSGSGSTVLTFRYTVNEDDLSGDLDYASTAALELNGGTIVSSSNTAAALSLPSIGSNKRIKKIVITENSGGHQTLKAIHMIVAPDGGSVIDVATTSLAGASTTDTHHQNNFGDDRLVINLLQNKTNNKSYTFNSPATAEITFNQSYSINDLHEFTFYGWARYGGGYYGRIANFNFSFKDDDGTEVYSFTSPSTYINGSSQLVVHRLIGEKGASDGSIWQDDINGHFSSAGYGSGWYVNDHTLPSHGGGSSLASVKNIVIDGILAPTITQTQIALDNSSVSLSFSEAVFNTNSGSGSLQANDFTLSLSGGNATLSSTTPSSISIDGTTVTLGLALSGTPNGKELLTVSPAVNSIYDSGGTAAEPTQNNNTSHLIPNIVTTNLALFLDAANNSSYSGSGNNWYDLSGNNNHGVIDGAGYSAVGGGSISFDGTNDQVIIQDNNTLDFSSEITISYVLEPNWGTWSPFISKGGGTNNRNFSTWVGSDKGIDIDNLSSGSMIKPTYTASSEMANGRLSVVTVAIDNSTGILRTYVNGILRNSRSGTLGSPNSGLLYIGNHGDENFGSGKINKLLLYNQALTNDQVYQNYLAITNTPQITVTSITSDNSSASLTFDQVTFNTDAGSGSLQASDFILSLSGGNATLSSATPSSISISGNTIELGLSLSGVVDGNEVLTISPVAHAVFNTNGFAATLVQSNNTVNLNFTNSVPTDIALSSSSIDENVVTGTTIGALSSTDADAGDIHNYSLISGTGDTDNGSFTVSGTSLLTATALDFEVKSSYAIRLETSDGSATYSKTLTITVNDVNEAPTDIDLSATTVDENLTSGTIIGGLTTTDVDSGDTFTYTLVGGGSDNDSFSISGTNLVTGAGFDFEIKNSYSIVIQTSDGSATYSKTLTIAVNDVNEASTDIDLSATAVDENLTSGTVVGGLNTTDVDSGDTFTYTLVDGVGSDDNASFSISGGSGGSYALDFDGSNDHVTTSIDADRNVMPSTTWSGWIKPTGTSGWQVIFGMEDGGWDRMLIVESGSLQLSMGQTGGRWQTGVNVLPNVWQHVVAVYDNGSMRMYFNGTEYSTGNDEGNHSSTGMFTIGGNQTHSPHNYFGGLIDEVAVWDEALSASEISTLYNTGSGLDASSDSGNYTSSSNLVGYFKMNEGSGTIITDSSGSGNSGTLTNMDASSDWVTGTIAPTSQNQGSGTDLLTDAVFDYETKSSYNIRVQTSDGMSSYEEAFTISVNDVNDVPTDIDLSTSSVNENVTTGTTVGELTTIDADNGDTFTYTLVAGTGATDNVSFSISGANLLTAAALDFETKSSYSIRVQTSDGTDSYQKVFTISVDDVNEAPTSIEVSGSTGGGSQMISSGLIVHLDASNAASTATPNSSWIDLSGNGNHGDIMNG